MELEIHAKVAIWDLGAGIIAISLVFCSRAWKAIAPEAVDFTSLTSELN